MRTAAVGTPLAATKARAAAVPPRASTTTELVRTSTYQPGTDATGVLAAVRSSPALTASSVAALRVTTVGVAPAALTSAARRESVTATTNEPAPSVSQAPANAVPS